MSKLFIDTIVQYGGVPTDSDAVVLLNNISKAINKKMKILEYKYGINFKLSKLPEDNWDTIPKKVAIQTVAEIDGPLKGNIPLYTNVDFHIPTPTVEAVTTGIPITPFGPVLGVPSLAINPFGNADNLKERNKKAFERLKLLKKIESQLEELKAGKIKKKDVDTTCFTFVDLEEPDILASLDEAIGLETSPFYSDL